MEKTKTKQLLSMSREQIEMYVDAGNNCGQDLIDLHSELAATKEKLKLAERVVNAAEYCFLDAGPTSLDHLDKKFDDMIEAIKAYREKT